MGQLKYTVGSDWDHMVTTDYSLTFLTFWRGLYLMRQKFSTYFENSKIARQENIIQLLVFFLGSSCLSGCPKLQKRKDLEISLCQQHRQLFSLCDARYTLLFSVPCYVSLIHKVNRCLVRYSPRAKTTNQPTNRAPKKPAWPGPN